MLRRRILLVEDDRSTREAMAHLLRYLGLEVRACPDAEIARRVVVTYVPDIALLDIDLPGMHGDDFAAFLQQCCPSTRIIFVSAEDGPNGAERFGRNVTFMPKPVNFPVLLDRLQN